MLLNKRANLVTDNTIELIIAAAGIVVLIFLFVALYSPTYNANAETAESYFKMFNEQLSSADSEIEGSVTFWGGEQEKVNYYLAYFQSWSSFKKENMIFVTRKKNENTICVCYGNKDKIHCDDCRELDLEVEYSESAPWIIGPVNKLKINKIRGKYLFSD